jgi:hypothetical protein
VDSSGSAPFATVPVLLVDSSDLGGNATSISLEFVGGDGGHSAPLQRQTKLLELGFDAVHGPCQHDQGDNDREGRGQQGPTHEDDATDRFMNKR